MTNAVTWLANEKSPVVASSSSDPVSWNDNSIRFQNISIIILHNIVMTRKNDFQKRFFWKKCLIKDSLMIDNMTILFEKKDSSKKIL